MENKINEDLRKAMKEKDTLKVETLRMIKSAFTAAKTEKNAKDFDDTSAIRILQKLVKTREETAITYGTAGRKDLMEKEFAESVIIKTYLPDVIEETELNLIIANVIIELEPTKKDMGKVMKRVTELASETGKAVDGSVIAAKVKHFLL